ncbi:MAG: hypothetical protein HZB26_09920 [Candidatus Hydrogenedentes bacterium]|nr:hypothetical protein [Candidatus Hydrogenedentota bacterium]
MALGAPSSCLNHPGVEATGRCKQCGKPFCNACAVSGPTGRFCSDTCKEKHQVFIQRAQQLDRQVVSGGFLRKLRSMAIKLVIWAVAILAVAFILTKYAQIEVPILSDLLRRYVGA